MLSWSAQWLDGKHLTKGLIDYPGYEKDREDDRALVTDLWGLFNEADILVGQNSDRFDIRKANARFAELGLPPPEPYRTVDTLKIAKKHFAFSSNSLNDLAQRLGVGKKVKTGGFDLWKACYAGDPKAWKLMKKYNRHDVVILSRVYERLRPWASTHPNLGVLSGKSGCPKCGEGVLHKRGFGISGAGRYQRFQCSKCGSWSKGTAQRVTTVSPI